MKIHAWDQFCPLLFRFDFIFEYYFMNKCSAEKRKAHIYFSDNSPDSKVPFYCSGSKEDAHVTHS